MHHALQICMCTRDFFGRFYSYFSLVFYDIFGMPFLKEQCHEDFAVLV